jgi:hypothetical protein
MSSHNSGAESFEGCPLPIVSDDTLAGLSADCQHEPGHIAMAMRRMSGENHALARETLELLDMLCDGDIAKIRDFSLVAVIVYEGLRRQAIADKMNRDYDEPDASG